MQLLKSLNHPNILQFIGILYKERKVLVLITEYADGGTLRKTIKNTERLFPMYLRISIARDIAAGMVGHTIAYLGRDECAGDNGTSRSHYLRVTLQRQRVHKTHTNVAEMSTIAARDNYRLLCNSEEKISLL